MLPVYIYIYIYIYIPTSFTVGDIGVQKFCNITCSAIEKTGHHMILSLSISITII